MALKALQYELQAHRLDGRSCRCGCGPCIQQAAGKEHANPSLFVASGNLCRVMCVCVCDSTAANTAHELPLLTSGCMANLRGSSRKKPILWERLWEGACQCQWEARAGCSAWFEPGVQLNPHGGARSSVVIVCYRYSIADDSFYAQLPAAFARN